MCRWRKKPRCVLVLAYSAFEKTKLREGMFNESHLFSGQGKFLPLLSIWPGLTNGTSWGKSCQQFRNTEGSLENYVQYFRTCKMSSMEQADHRSSRLANRNWQGDRGVRGPEKMLCEVVAWSFLTAQLTTVRLENMPEWPHWPAILMAAFQQVEWIMEGRMICFVQVIAG